MMCFHILASGSSGNSVCVETKEHLIFIDAGIALRDMAEFALPFEGSKSIKLFITHEHSDHKRSCLAFASKFNLRPYLSLGTAKRIAEGLNLREHFEIVEGDTVYNFGSFAVETFRLSHDAAEPLGYLVHTEEGSVGVLTDTGYVPDSTLSRLRQAHTLLIEANFDTEMLKNGEYPSYLKRRILSPLGHLSNENAVQTAINLSDGKLTRCLFGHVSENNNDYARLEKLSAFVEKEFDIETHVIKQRTYYRF